MEELFKGLKFRFEGSYLTQPITLNGIKLYQLGETCCEPNFKTEEHWQCCHEITYVISGSGVITDNGNIYEISEGDIFFSPFGHLHSIIANVQEPLRYAYIGFSILDDTPIIELKKIDIFLNNTQKLKAKVDERLMYPFLQSMEEFYTKSDFSIFMIETYIWQILVDSYRALNSGSDENENNSFIIKETQSVGRAVYSMIRYIDEHIYDLANIRDIAKELGYSACYISHTFKEKTGVTVKQYISKKKIHKSVELLETGKFSVTKVAQILNYSNVQSFSRTFKQIIGVYPSKYLKNLNSGLNL